MLKHWILNTSDGYSCCLLELTRRWATLGDAGFSRRHITIASNE